MVDILGAMRVQLLTWNDMSVEDRQLISRAMNVRMNSSPTESGFMVGAALRMRGSNRIFKGCNVEDYTHTSTIHAEISAVGAMVAVCGQKAKCESIAIVLGPKDQKISCPPQFTGEGIVSLEGVTNTPCGHCRTVLAQYGGPNVRLLMLQNNNQIAICSLADLYPCGFSYK